MISSIFLFLCRRDATTGGAKLPAKLKNVGFQPGHVQKQRQNTDKEFVFLQFA